MDAVSTKEYKYSESGYLNTLWYFQSTSQLVFQIWFIIGQEILLCVWIDSIKLGMNSQWIPKNVGTDHDVLNMEDNWTLQLPEQHRYHNGKD